MGKGSGSDGQGVEGGSAEGEWIGWIDGVEGGSAEGEWAATNFAAW